jgi:esterase/lipase superfamily enzyme
MAELTNVLFLQALNAQLDELETLLATSWPQFRELLASVNRRIAEAADPSEISEGVDDIIELLKRTAAGELVRDLLSQALRESGADERTFRGDPGELPETEAALATKAAAQGAILANRLDYTESHGVTLVPIFYATDRQPSAKGLYGRDRGTLEYGAAIVSIPTDNRIGTLPKPRWWKGEFSANPSRHVILLDAQHWERQVFVNEIRQVLAESPHAGVLVFVHGYNTTFEDAARRAALLSYDLQYKGIVLLYSWPSLGRVARYMGDETNAQWTQPHLEEVLRLVLDQMDAARLDIVAHSMGSRPVLGAVRALNLPAAGSKLRHLVLAAPDIDGATFRELAQKLHERARRFTLYASSGDWALWFSKFFHGFPRAGESGDSLVVLRPTLDTVDASLVDTSLLGHSYYGDNRSIVSDLFLLFKEHLPPPRFGMLRKETTSGEYWVFKA